MRNPGCDPTFLKRLGIAKNLHLKARQNPTKGNGAKFYGIQPKHQSMPYSRLLDVDKKVIRGNEPVDVDFVDPYLKGVVIKGRVLGGFHGFSLYEGPRRL